MRTYISFFPAEKRPSANNNNKVFNPKYLG
jgi:hypothetical protein